MMILVSAAAGLVVILALRELAWLAAPVLLALVIVILVHPLHGWMRRRGVPPPIALGALLLGIYGVLVGLAAIIALSLARLVTVLPRYAGEASELLRTVAGWLAQLGIDQEPARQLLAGLELNRLAGLLTGALSAVVGFGASLVFLLGLLLFLGIESTGINQRLAAMQRTRPRSAEALVGFAVNTRRFLAVTTVFAVLVGAADTLFLLWLGIPLALLWGVLALVCNYIPYVGFVIGLVPPALLALLQGGVRLMVVVIVVYIVLNSLFTSLIPPYFVGDAVGMSITVTLISVVFWAWVLGPIGAILAIPLTLLVKAVLVDPDPAAAWAQGLIGANPRERPDRRFWRRAT